MSFISMIRRRRYSIVIHLTSIKRGVTPRAYGYEMTDEEHAALAKVLNAAKGMAAISNYSCDLMDQLYPPPKWRKVVSPDRTIHSTKGTRAEVVWTN